ncbi:ATP-binding protein [Cupriavidus sp. NPDC089707]|uniref:ATP-binding protein n=1 Tax=Cupriavidus sp. NPDC089707 TaxID=3363963 RepID=UPI003826AC32
MYSFGKDDFYRMVEALTLRVILHDVETKSILWANRAARETLGFTLEEFPALKAPDMTSSAAKYRREVGLKWLDDAARTGQSVIEWCYRAKNGNEILSEAIATRVSLESRDVLIVQFRDISAEEALKRELRRSKSRLREFMHDLAEGVVVVDRGGCVVYVSESGCRILGRAEEDVLGATFDTFCEVPLMPLLRDNVPPDATTRGSFSTRYRVRTAAGELQWHQAAMRYVEIEDDVSGYLLLFRDVTAQVEAESLEREREREIEYLARYNAMGEMAMTIAHELSQPLAATRNFIEGASMRLAKNHADPHPIRFGLEAAARQVEHASLIIKSIREYVVKLEQAEVLANLNDIVNDSAYFISLKCEEADVRLELALSADPLPISCEKVLIGQVILNIAFNAIEEMATLPSDRRTLRIETCAAADKAILSVHDQGRGLPHANSQRIFDGFFSGKPGGNGIGLALCKSIVSRHRGDIWAQNRVPYGTSFAFSVPLCASPAYRRRRAADRRAS